MATATLDDIKQSIDNLVTAILGAGGTGPTPPIGPTPPTGASSVEAEAYKRIKDASNACAEVFHNSESTIKDIEDAIKTYKQAIEAERGNITDFDKVQAKYIKAIEQQERYKNQTMASSLRSPTVGNLIGKGNKFETVSNSVKYFSDKIPLIGGALGKVGSSVASLGAGLSKFASGPASLAIGAVDMVDKVFAKCAEKAMQYQKLHHEQYLRTLGAETIAQVNAIRVSVTALSNAVQASTEAITANIETNLVQAKAIADNQFAQLQLNHQWTNWIPIVKTLNKIGEQRMQIQNAAAEAEISNAQKIAQEWINSTNKINDAMNKMDESQRAYQRLTGLPSAQMAEFREGLYKAGEAVAEFGKTADDILKARTAFINESGRNIAWSQADTTKALSTGTLVGDSTMNSFAAGMVLFNTSVADSAEIMLNVYKDANKMGVSSQKLTKSVLSNLKQANKYNFKEGVEGFIKAAKWAETARYDMASLGATLDKVQEGGLEGVLQQSAQLQVLGGNAAMGADPMRMMYAAYNDPEAYAKMQQDALKNFGHINSKTGETQFNMADQMQISAIAKAYGLSKDQAMEMARASNKRSAIEMANGRLSGDELDAIANRAQFNKETKQWEVTMADGSTKNVSQLSSSDIEKIAPEDVRSSEEIAKDTLNATEKIAVEAAHANILLAKMGGLEEYLRHVDETTKITREGNDKNAEKLRENQKQVYANGEESLRKEFERFATASNFAEATNKIDHNVEILALSKKERRKERRGERRDIREAFEEQLGNATGAEARRAIRRDKRNFKDLWRAKGKIGFSEDFIKAQNFSKEGVEHMDDGLILHSSGKVVAFNDNDNIMAAKDGGFFSKAMNSSSANNKEISVKPIEINLNGTLNLSGGGQNVNIIDLLKNNQEFLKQLSQMISAEMGKALNGGKSVAWNGRFGK